MASTDQLKKYYEEYDDAKKNFLYYYKPEFDRAYKQFAQYTGDRAKELERTTEGEVWQSNAYWGQVFAYIKIFLQKTIGMAPDFKLEGKNSEPLKQVINWLWEVGMSDDLIDHFLQTFICGTSLGKDILKKEVKKKRKKEVVMIEEEPPTGLFGEMIGKLKSFYKKLTTKSEIASITFRPDFEPVDMYNCYPHPRMKTLSDKLPLFQRYVLTLDEMKEQYPNMPESFWNQFKDKAGNVVLQGGDITDYAWVRKEVLTEARQNIRDTKSSTPFSGGDIGIPADQPQMKEKLFEVVERWVDDHLIVFLPMSGTPKEIKDIDNPYDHSDKPYKRIVFFPRPFQFYGFGIVKLVEKLQDLLNSVVNQRVDSVTLKMHSMIAAAPVAMSGHKKGITVRPLGILWTSDPNSVRELKFGDVNPSAYLEPDKIKEMMRVIIGIDDYSTLKGTDRKETATVASFMREATLEGVKLFLIMMRNAYTGHFDHWISMIKQFWTRRSVVPKKALAIIDDFADTDFTPLEESWIGENGEHLLFNDEYELSIEASSTLATSTELKKAKDLELWELVKDAGDMIDEESGQIYSIKKFKILMKVIDDYGWEAENYVVPRQIPQEVVDNQITPPAIPPAELPPAEVPAPRAPALPGRRAGGELAAALRQ